MEDAFFVKRALDKSGLRHVIQSVNDGTEAVAYLQGLSPYSDRKRFPFPNILLCDLETPKMDGCELLRWLQAHPESKVIPTIAFSSSALEADVHQSYVLGANAYIEKPASPEALSDLIHHLHRFWRRCQVPEPPQGQKCC